MADPFLLCPSPQWTVPRYGVPVQCKGNGPFIVEVLCVSSWRSDTILFASSLISFLPHFCSLDIAPPHEALAMQCCSRLCFLVKLAWTLPLTIPVTSPSAHCTWVLSWPLSFNSHSHFTQLSARTLLVKSWLWLYVLTPNLVYPSPLGVLRLLFWPPFLILTILF